VSYNIIVLYEIFFENLGKIIECRTGVREISVTSRFWWGEDNCPKNRIRGTSRVKRRIDMEESVSLPKLFFCINEIQ